ncbi:MAG: 2Fe-2S iron-sulfur cluster-binding protein [Gammaproteobacteria bacterium]
MHLSNTNVAFAAAGGIVPALSIIKRLLGSAPADRVLVFYGTQEGEHAEPLEQLLALKDRHLDRLSLSFVTNREADEAELLTGPLDGAKVGALAGKLFDPQTVQGYFVCGSQALIDDVTGALKQVGVPPDRIHGEDSDARGETATAVPGSATATGATSAQPATAANETRVALVLDGRRRTFNMITGEETILDAAARAGIELPYSCKAGVCSTCRTKLVSGKVDLAQNYALEDWELEQGFILACQAHAKTPEIEITYDEK